LEPVWANSRFSIRFGAALGWGQEIEMADQATNNGTDGSGSRERPSWYVPVRAIPEDDTRTGREVLLDTFGDEPLELSEETQEELLAYLNQFRVPRES
jgi:hypothetical protein